MLNEFHTPMCGICKADNPRKSSFSPVSSLWKKWTKRRFASTALLSKSDTLGCCRHMALEQLKLESFGKRLFCLRVIVGEISSNTFEGSEGMLSFLLSWFWLYTAVDWRSGKMGWQHPLWAFENFTRNFSHYDSEAKKPFSETLYFIRVCLTNPSQPKSIKHAFSYLHRIHPTISVHYNAASLLVHWVVKNTNRP